MTIEALYKYYLAGFNGDYIEGLDDLLSDYDREQALDSFETGQEHGRRAPMPPNLPASFHVFSGFFPYGILGSYARP